MRLNQYLAQRMGWSRREADRQIEAGRVKVNNRTAKVGERVDPATARVTVRGQTLPRKKIKAVTIALYKPAGYLSVRRDKRKRPTVMDLLPPELHRLKPAGRLDKDSEGLLLFSSDGDFILRATHPRYGHEREYRLTLERPVTKELLKCFLRGVKLREGVAKADRAEKTKQNELTVVLHQGWYRQLRRMAKSCKNRVVKLTRVRSGPFTLGSLKPGEYKRVDTTGL